MDLLNFTNLIYLDCSVNPLTSLDVSQNIHLNYLDCSGINFFGPTGQMINLNVSQNSSLSLKLLGDVDTTTLDDGALLQYRASDQKFVTRTEIITTTGSLVFNCGQFEG